MARTASRLISAGVASRARSSTATRRGQHTRHQSHHSEGPEASMNHFTRLYLD
jgi:hypothetical protein